MKWLMAFLFCLSFATSASPHAASPQETSPRVMGDLTAFDEPLLLGDWYLVNPNQEKGAENFLLIRLRLRSDYSFQIRIQKRDYTVNEWSGDYEVNDNQLTIGLNSAEPQRYAFKSNHNLLILNGIVFTKGLPNDIAGRWSSEALYGADLAASDIETMDLVLQPDFVFMFRVIAGDGEQSVKRGVYFVEEDHLVLLYENGEHDTHYTLDKNKLTLTTENGETYAVLGRMQ